jgi:hypothetical protein
MKPIQGKASIRQRTFEIIEKSQGNDIPKAKPEDAAKTAPKPKK